MMNLRDLFFRIDPSTLKSFYWAAKELNFTRAAEKGALTQSGISQHISHLETELGVKLFTRVNKKVLLTEEGKVFLGFLEDQQLRLEKLEPLITKGSGSVEGLVRYAMPHSCLFTPHFPMLLEGRKNYLGIELEVTLMPNEEIVQRLLNLEIDFGFVTSKSDNPALDHKPFAKEEYHFIGAPKIISNAGIENLHELPWVDYPGMGDLFETWKQKHFPKRKSLRFESLNIVGRINSLNGAVMMLVGELGATIIQEHVTEPFLSQKKLVRWNAQKPACSEIHIVTLRGAVLPRRVNTVLDLFWKMKG